MYGDEVALKVAAITKLTRNLLLAGVIPGLTYSHVQSERAVESSTEEKEIAISGLATFQKYVPSFLFGFIAMAGVRSTGDLYLLDYKAYKPLIKFAGSDVSSVLRFFRNF